MGADNPTTQDKTKKQPDAAHPADSQPDTDKAAHNTASDAQKAMSQHGAEAAYAALKTDYDNFVKSTHGNQAQDKAYWDQVTKELGGLLPKVSIAWGEEQAKALGKPLDQATLRAEQHSINPFEASLANSLAPQVKEVKTSSDGHVVTKFNDNSTQSLNPKDGSVVTSDAQGRTTSVHYSDGTTRSFGYDAKSGAVNQVTETDGKVYKLQDGKWLGPDNSDTHRANVQVRKDGTYSYQNADGTTVSTTSSNSKAQMNADGSTVRVDSANRPTEIDYKDGKRTQFGYDAQGHVNKVVSADGSTVTLQNGKWLDSKGQDTGMSDVRVQADGSYMYQSKGTEHVISTADRQQQFDTKSIEKAAHDLHDAAHHKLGGIGIGDFGIKSPETDTIQNILEPMSAAQRQLVQEAYQRQNNGKTLDADLKDNLSAPDYAHMQGIIKRQDGVADNTGQVWQAIAKLKDLPKDFPGDPPSDDRVRAEKEIRDSINTLTADQLRAVEAKYKQDYGQDMQSSLLNNPDISAQSKQALKTYFQGNDHISDEDRLKLADMALKQNRPDIFDEAFRDAKQSARDKFIANGGMKKIDDTFSGGDAQIAKDYVQRGTVSLATIVDGDTHWYHTNKDDISRAVTNATDKDRKDFARGEQLAQSKQTPTTDDDKRALDFYQKVDKAAHGAGNDREAALWETKLRNNESVLPGILDSHNDGSWFFNMGDKTDKNKEMSAIENMSQKDWTYLKQHPEEVARIDKALGTFDDSHHDEVMNMLKAKLAANVTDFAAAQKVGNRAIDERLKDSEGDTSARVNALTGMTATERQQYASNSNGFRDKINGLLKSDEEKTLADQLSKTKGDPTPVEKVLIDGLKNDNPNATFTDMEAAFKADPTLKDRMNNPQTAEDKKLSQYFHDASRGAVDKAGLGDQSYGDGGYIPGQYDKYDKAIFKDGHVPLDMQLSLTQDKDTRTNLIVHCSDADRARLLNKNPDAATKQFQDTVFGDNKDVRQVLTNALQETDPKTGKPGYLDPADQFKLFVAQGGSKEGGNSDQLKGMLEGMTPEQRQDLANKYFTKYGKLVTEEVVPATPSEQQFRFRELLSPTDVNVRQVALDAQLSNDSHTSSWDNFMKQNWDYSRVSADSTQDNLNKFVSEHAAELNKLSPEQRKQFDDALSNFQKAQKAYVDSKGQMAEALVDATVTVAAIAGAAFTAGTSLSLLATLGAAGAGGAILRTGMMASIEGKDFDSSAGNLLKQGFEGGASAMLAFLGPEALGIKGLAVGEDVAAITAGKLLEGAGTKAMFKEGSEQVLKEGLANITRQGAMIGDKEIAALAEKVAADGVDKNIVEQTIRQQLKQDVQTGMKNIVKNEAEAYARNMLAAQVGVQGKEILATVAGFESPDTLLDRMKGGAISVAAGVTLFHGVIRGATELKIALGRDPAGHYVAGEGTPVRHADGSIEIVKAGKPMLLGTGDTIAENVSPKNGAWGQALTDAKGQVAHFEDGTGRYTRVPGKPDTWLDGQGHETKLTNVKVNSDGSLEYNKEGVNYKYDGKTGEVTHPLKAETPADPVVVPPEPPKPKPTESPDQPPPGEAPEAAKPSPKLEAPEPNETPEQLNARIEDQKKSGLRFLIRQLRGGMKTAVDDPAFKPEIERETAIVKDAKAALDAGNTEEANRLLRSLPQATEKEAKTPWAKDGTIPPNVANDPQKLKDFLQGKINAQNNKLDLWTRSADGTLQPMAPEKFKELQQSFKQAANGNADSPFEGIARKAQDSINVYEAAGAKDEQLQDFFGKIDPEGNYKLSVYDAITGSGRKGAINKEQLIEKLEKPHALDTLSPADRANAEEQIARAKADVAKAMSGRAVLNEGTELPSSFGKNAPESFRVGADNPNGKAEFQEALKAHGVDPESKAVKDFMSGDARTTDYKIVHNANGDTMLLRFDKSDTLNQSKAYALVLKPNGEPAFKGPNGEAVPKLHITFNTNYEGGPLKDVKVELGGKNKPTIYDLGGTKDFGQLTGFEGSGFANAQELIDYLNSLFKGVEYPPEK